MDNMSFSDGNSLTIATAAGFPLKGVVVNASTTQSSIGLLLRLDVWSSIWVVPGYSRVTTTEIYTHINQEFELSSIERLTGVMS